MFILSYISALFLILGAECSAIFIKDIQEYENISVNIPRPTGITLSEVVDDNGQLHTYGYLEHNAIALRETWSTVVSLPNVLSDIESNIVISTAEKHASRKGGWTKGHRSNVATTELSLLSVFGSQSEVFYELVGSLIFPGISKHYGVNQTDLFLSSLSIIKYDASASEQSAMEGHNDDSTFSFAITLNDGFSGGGIQFMASDEIWTVPIGTAVLYSGQLVHADLPITSGVRYILSGFLKMGTDDNNFRMNYYSPKHDGFAAQAGFISGDEIVNVPCSPSDSDFEVGEHSCLADDKADVMYVVRRVVVPVSVNATLTAAMILVDE